MASPRKLTIMSLFATVIMLSTSPFCTIARELRPEDHGLAYQASPPSGHEMSPQMMSFFGTSASASSSSSTWSSSNWRSSSPPRPAMALPTAMDSSNPSWLRNGGGGDTGRGAGGGGGGRDHVKQGLIVGTVVCGITGLCFLAVSAVIFVLKSRKAQPTTTLGNVVSGDTNVATK